MKLLELVSHRLKRLWKRRLAQDLIEYALMAGFVAVAAGALMPSVAQSISKIFSAVASTIDEASETGTSS
ncbi:MAG TPA: Flp family type IVb pilin [Bryobacteraceae bacterium]|nr:Flp family type IVb pilin [Bryobacteraceae bacterium]